jgi:hypothetical protein
MVERSGLKGNSRASGLEYSQAGRALLARPFRLLSVLAVVPSYLLVLKSLLPFYQASRLFSSVGNWYT